MFILRKPLPITTTMPNMQSRRNNGLNLTTSKHIQTYEMQCPLVLPFLGEGIWGENSTLCTIQYRIPPKCPAVQNAPPMQQCMVLLRSFAIKLGKSSCIPFLLDRGISNARMMKRIRIRKACWRRAACSRKMQGTQNAMFV